MVHYLENKVGDLALGKIRPIAYLLFFLTYGAAAKSSLKEMFDINWL